MNMFIVVSILSMNSLTFFECLGHVLTIEAAFILEFSMRYTNYNKKENTLLLSKKVFS